MKLPDLLDEILKNEERWERIYNKINGEYDPYLCEGVNDEASEDGALGPLIRQIYQARNRIAERLNVDPALDADFNLLIEGIEDYGRVSGKLMYHYGYQDGISAK